MGRLIDADALKGKFRGMLADAICAIIDDTPTALPMQKPLTFSEMIEQQAVWIEGQIDVSPALANGYQRDDGIYTDFTRSYGDCFIGKNKEYGKRWRCWATKPTDEERMAAEWEE